MVHRHRPDPQCWEYKRFATAVPIKLTFLNAKAPRPAIQSCSQGDGSLDDNGVVQGELAFDTAMVTARIEIMLKDNVIILPGSMFGDNKITAQMSMQTERYRGYFNAAEVD